eukprot:6491143-Amphidinium_carterae.1
MRQAFGSLQKFWHTMPHPALELVLAPVPSNLEHLGLGAVFKRVAFDVRAEKLYVERRQLQGGSLRCLIAARGIERLP